MIPSKIVSILLFLCNSTTNAWMVQQPSQQSQQQYSRVTTVLKNAKKFAQPAFAQAAHQNKNKNKRQQKQQDDDDDTNNPSIRRNNKNNSRRYNGDSSIAALHKERISTAGRVGTKRFVDPCKVFIGNLPYDCDETKLQSWVCDNILGLPSSVSLNQCKVIRDWKTGKSKGYGFVVLTEPVYATVLIDKCQHNATLASIDGRRLTVNQGKKKDVEQQLYLEQQAWKKRKEKQELSAEEAAIQKGVQQAEDEDTYMLPEEVAMWKALDPDLVAGVKIIGVDDVKEKEEEEEGEEQIATMNDEDDEIEEYELFLDDDEEEYDDSDDGVDGFWYGDVDDEDDIMEFVDENDDDEAAKMNREQRRQAARRKKKRKLPFKGFGSVTTTTSTTSSN